MIRLTNPAAFFDFLRRDKMLGPVLSPTEVSGLNALLEAFGRDDWPINWAAYGFATAYHETAGTMLPIKERGGDGYLTRMYDVTGDNPVRARRFGNTQPGDGVRFCGRGYVQLTWRANYQKAQDETGYPLISNPNLAMDPAIAATIMVKGMREGWFTGRRLADYLPSNPAAQAGDGYTQARRIINGTDKAVLIAGYAHRFEAALRAGGWR